MTELVKNDAAQVVADFDKLYEKFHEKLLAENTRLQHYVQYLVQEPMEQLKDASMDDGQKDSTPSLTVTGQCMIRQALENAKSLTAEVVADERSLHSRISRCGKDLDRTFESNLSGILKNEKDVEGDLNSRQIVDKLIYEYFLDSGFIDIAETLQRESAMQILTDKKRTLDDLRKIMDLFQQRELLPVIHILSGPLYKHKPQVESIVFDLHKQHMIKLMKAGDSAQALVYGRQHLQPYGNAYADEIQRLMGALVVFPNISPYYNDLFHPNTWQVLETDIAKLVMGEENPMETLLGVGATAMPSILSIKSVLAARAPFAGNEELPISISIPNAVHSTFTCPILKIQASESNPPVRLGCGHVISKDAVQKLSQNRTSRATRSRHNNNRMKCPYCPEEINTTENKRLIIN